MVLRQILFSIYVKEEVMEELDCFQRSLVYLYTKRLEKLGITAEIKVERIEKDDGD